MLTEIRDRATGWFAGAIAALIIIPMAFWGVGDYAPEGANPVILEVGEQKITQQAFQQQLANAQSRALSNNPSLANSDIFGSEQYKRQILDGMINSALAQDIADQQNYRVGDKQLATSLKKNELFQTDGKFDQDAYDVFVATRSASKTQFEEQLRENTRTYHVQAGYAESALVLPDEVRSLLEMQVEERSFDVIVFKQSDYLDGISVSEAEVNEHYKVFIDGYMEPDRVSVDYVMLDLETISKEVELSDESIQAIYDNDIERYRSTETREASHILLTADDGQSDSELLTKAQSLATELRGGADFSELAKQHSQDPGSANNGGSLGQIEPGTMVAEFEQAVFSLEQGAISDPVKTQFGYHIVKADKVSGAIVRPFEEVRDEIADTERERLANDILIERVELLRNLTFEQPDSLDGIAQELDISVQSTDLFARDVVGQGILESDLVRNAAFSEQVLSEGYNSEPIEIFGGSYIALRKKEFRASEPKSFESVSESIKESMTEDKASDKAATAGDAIIDLAESDWSKVKADETLDIQSFTVSLVDQNRPVNRDVLTDVFRMELNGKSQAFESFIDNNGDYYLIRLNGITAGDVSKASEQVKESTRRLIAQRNGASLFQSYLQGLTKDLESKINKDLL